MELIDTACAPGSATCHWSGYMIVRWIFTENAIYPRGFKLVYNVYQLGIYIGCRHLSYFMHSHPLISEFNLTTFK